MSVCVYMCVVCVVCVCTCVYMVCGGGSVWCVCLSNYDNQEGSRIRQLKKRQAFPWIKTHQKLGIGLELFVHADLTSQCNERYVLLLHNILNREQG